jgi:glycosyltransferase involved in cell wall biosynthesis
MRLCSESQFGDVHLVMVGSPGGASQDELRALRAICAGLERVKFPGALDDHDLVLALNRATVAVLPSLEEGFGLTGLEAVACGTPLIATRSSAMPELLGDAAVYFEPRDENALYAHLTELLADANRRHTLRERGLERAAALSWESGAMRLIEVFDAVLAP